MSTTDIMPTILDLLKITTPIKLEGRTLLPLISNQTQSLRDFIFIEYTGKAIKDKLAFRTTQLKYVFTKDSQYIYDLVNDPAEQIKIFPEKFNDETKQQVQIFKKYLFDNGYISSEQYGSD